jgi:hypothetical protein
MAMSGTTGRRRSRRWWAALALVALAFVSLRPACDVWLSHWAKHDGMLHSVAQRVVTHVTHEAPAHETHDTPCCASIERGALVKPSDVAIVGAEQPHSPGSPFFTVTALRIAAPLLHALTASVIPLGSPPFYVRSARILR